MDSKPNPQGIKPVTQPRCKHCGAVITGYEFLRRIQNLYRVPRDVKRIKKHCHCDDYPPQPKNQ